MFRLSKIDSCLILEHLDDMFNQLCCEVFSTYSSNRCCVHQSKQSVVQVDDRQVKAVTTKIKYKIIFCSCLIDIYFVVRSSIFWKSYVLCERIAAIGSGVIVASRPIIEAASFMMLCSGSPKYPGTLIIAFAT